MSIEPDTKDWTWVTDQACPDCRFDPNTIDREKLSDLIHENARGWYALLLDADAAVRPAPHVWSRLEYACHVRDVHRIFAERVQRMLDEDGPEFDNWDQDEAAAEERLRPAGPGGGRDRAGRASRRGGRGVRVRPR